MITLKSDRELEYMKIAGKIVAETHKELEKAIKPGITTKELDTIADNYILSCGAKPAFKGYQGFPASICTSINEAVVHGIPGLRELKDGNIISIDIGAVINGYYGDAARTYPVGTIDEDWAKLIRVTQEALDAGIAKAIEGNRLSDISNAVQVVAEGSGYSVVRDYVGHGIGREMHEDPQVPNFGKPGRGPRLRSGMVLAIEPMVNAGSYEVETLGDNWTVVTKDKSYSAHIEDTIAITPDGPMILTRI